MNFKNAADSVVGEGSTRSGADSGRLLHGTAAAECGSGSGGGDVPRWAVRVIMAQACALAVLLVAVTSLLLCLNRCDVPPPVPQQV